MPTTFADFLFPNTSCLGCRTELNDTKFLCKKCEGYLVFNEKTAALTTNEKQYFEAALAPFRYVDPIVNVVLSLKYGSAGDSASFLAPYMAKTFSEQAPKISQAILIPVPLHKKRATQRGYNQTLLIANAVSKILDFPVLNDVLVRTKDRSKEHKNLYGAFTVTDEKMIHGKIAIIIDDVFTTGATVNECAKALLHAGTSRVLVLTAALV